jgi:hypothetical protein
MPREFIGKVFPDYVMPMPTGEGIGIEEKNGLEVRDAGSAGNRTPNAHLDFDEVTTVRLKDAPGFGERVTLDDSTVLTSPAMRKGLIL